MNQPYQGLGEEILVDIALLRGVLLCLRLFTERLQP